MARARFGGILVTGRSRLCLPAQTARVLRLISGYRPRLLRRSRPMVVLISLVVCLSNAPAICEPVTPDYVRADSGAGPTLLECLGASGQDIARMWLPQHPSYVLRRVQCSAANDARKLRASIEGAKA